jgi:hypothetical protein
MLFVAVVTACVVEGAASMVNFLPFTQAYEPGRARLRTRWWFYLVGVYSCAYLPARLELRAGGRPFAQLMLLAGVGALGAMLAAARRARAVRWRIARREEPIDPLARLHVLDIAGIVPNS